jgi:hypothetical protein
MAISFVDLLTDEEKGAIAARWMANIYRFRRGEITSQELIRLTPFIQWANLKPTQFTP